MSQIDHCRSLKPSLILRDIAASKLAQMNRRMTRRWTFSHILSKDCAREKFCTSSESLSADLFPRIQCDSVCGSLFPTSTPAPAAPLHPTLFPLESASAPNRKNALITINCHWGKCIFILKMQCSEVNFAREKNVFVNKKHVWNRVKTFADFEKFRKIVTDIVRLM